MIHVAEDQCFIIELDRDQAVLSYQLVGNTAINLIHTEVPPAFQGRGLAKALILRAFTYATNQQLRVIPTCPTVSGFLRRHPEYRYVMETPK